MGFEDDEDVFGRGKISRHGAEVRTAYLVGVIDTDHGKFLGCSIFSEDGPTLGANRFCFTIHKENGADYSEALAKLTSALACSPSLAWAKSYLKGRG